MRLLKVLLVCMGCVVGACGWGHAAATGGGAFRVAGRVVDAVSGEPVRGATVSLLSREYQGLAASGVTDNEGRFSFEGVAAGKYPLSTAKRGYLTTLYDQHDGFNCAIVTGAGVDTENLLVRITPQGVLRGVVSGEGGDPVEHAEVMLFRRPEHAGGKIVQMETANADDTGAYEFTRLEPGEYFLAVRGVPWYAQHGMGAREEGQERSELDVTYPVTFYDSTTDENSATVIKIAAGDRVQADINMHAVTALRIKEPEAMRGQPGAQLRQSLFGQLVGVPTEEISTGPNGPRELVGVAPGNYEVEVGRPPRVMALNLSSDAEIDANAGAATVPVSGTVAMMGGGRVPERVELSFEPVDAPGEPEVAVVLGNRFSTSGFAPGNWRVNAAAGGKQVAVVAVGNQPGSTFAVKDQAAPVVITLARGQTRIDGFAKKNDKPAAGVLMALVPRAAAAYGALARFDESDLDGSFSLLDVPPGEYTLVAIEDGWKLDRDQREQMLRYLPQGTAVSIREDAPAVVRLDRVVAAVPR